MAATTAVVGLQAVRVLGAVLGRQCHPHQAAAGAPVAVEAGMRVEAATAAEAIEAAIPAWAILK